MGVNVDLHDFSHSEIEDFAEDHLDMIKVDDITLEYLHEKYDIFDFLESLGGIVHELVHLLHLRKDTIPELPTIRELFKNQLKLA